MAEENIPVIDLGDLPVKLPELIRACEEWGCFRIVSFDDILSVSLMQEMKEVAAELLELPPEIKKRNIDPITGRGYRAPGSINPIHEGLGLYDIVSSQAIGDFCTQLNVTPRQRETITRYGKAVHEVATYLGRKIGEGLGLTKVPFDNWPCRFRFNKYPFTTKTIGSDGLRTHTDDGFLTILQEDERFGGLEVMRKSGKFFAVEPCPGTLLVNMGDTATAWSNGRFYNVKHRVVSKQEGIRISIATFMLGPKEEVVEAPPELVTSENPRLYVPFLFEDVRKARFQMNMNEGEALDFFRVESSKSSNH